MDVEEPQRLFLLDLPYECLVEIFLLLDAAEICAAASCSKEARAVAAADVLWRELCVKGQHGASLQFKEMLGTFSHPDARRAEKKEAAAAADGAAASSAPPPAVRRGSSTSSTGTPWREVYFRSLDTLKTDRDGLKAKLHREQQEAGVLKEGSEKARDLMRDVDHLKYREAASNVPRTFLAPSWMPA